MVPKLTPDEEMCVVVVALFRKRCECEEEPMI